MIHHVGEQQEKLSRDTEMFDAITVDFLFTENTILLPDCHVIHKICNFSVIPHCHIGSSDTDDTLHGMLVSKSATHCTLSGKLCPVDSHFESMDCPKLILLLLVKVTYFHAFNRY